MAKTKAEMEAVVDTIRDFMDTVGVQGIIVLKKDDTQEMVINAEMNDQTALNLLMNTVLSVHEKARAPFQSLLNVVGAFLIKAAKDQGAATHIIDLREMRENIEQAAKN